MYINNKVLPYLDSITVEKKENKEFNCEEALKTSRNLYITHKEDSDYLAIYEIIFLKYIGEHTKSSELTLEKLQALKNPTCIKELYPLLLHNLRHMKNNGCTVSLMEILSENVDYKLLVYNDLREFYTETSDTDKIIKYCKLMIETGYCETYIYEQLAKCYDEKGSYEEAFKYYVKAGQNYYNKQEYHWMNAGRALVLSGKVEEALFYFKMALMLNPEEQYAHYYLGKFYQTKEDLYSTMYHYTEAVKYSSYYKAVSNKSLFNLENILNKKDHISDIETSLLPNYDVRFLPILYLSLVKLYRTTHDFERCEFYQEKFINSMGLHFQDMQRV